MVCERTLKNKMLIGFRKFGLIKKKKFMRPMKVRTIINYEPYSSNIESQQHVYIQNKLSVRKNCSFDVNTKTCKCGANLEEFLVRRC